MFEGVCESAVQAADPFALAAALAGVSQDQLASCTQNEAECVVAATQRIVNAATARQSVAVTRYTEHVLDARDEQREARYASGAPLPVGQPSPVQQAAAGLAPVLRLAPRTMVTRIRTAQTFSGLPRSAAMGWAGDLEPYRVTVITQAARDVGHEQLSEFEARLHHGDIRELPGSRLKTRAALIAARLAPQPDPTDPADEPGSDGRVEEAAAQRQVRVGPGEQAGLTRWDAQLPAESSRSMWAAVEALAAQYRADNPQLSVAQSRADALTDLVLSDVQVTTTATLIIPTTPTTDRAGDADPADSSVAAAAGEPSQTVEPGADTEPGAEPMPAPNAPSGPGCDEASTGEASDLASGPVPAGSAALRRLTPPPGCSCAGRARSWVELLEPLERPSVVLAGPWAQDLPESPIEQRSAAAVQHALAVDANPRLARDRSGRVWFVPKPVSVAPVGLLLPAQVNALLADPDTIIRLGAAHPDTGAVHMLEERTYRPGAALARLVRARDGTCRYPGCATAAERCDLDHVIAYPHGPTTASNLQTLCRAHHGFKHHGGWTVTMTPEGICTWTAPNGRSHTTHPHNLHDDAA